jgi:hypothetical protein
VVSAVGNWSLAAEVPVQTYSNSCRLRVGKCGTSAGFPLSAGVYR